MPQSKCADVVQKPNEKRRFSEMPPLATAGNRIMAQF